MKYIVKNRLTDAICGEFETYGQAGKWVEDIPTNRTRDYLPTLPSTAPRLTSS
nr:MAG TPA: hypothetical protein [Caudoviricetes sp.]